jgi:hypothetical protein
MKQLLLLILLCLPVIGFGQNVNIPDANFKAYLVGSTSPSGVNTNGDDEIQVSEAAAYAGVIACNGLSISDLTGIEAFTSVSKVYCSQNQLTFLDLSANTALATLYCYDNQLTSLDLSQNTDLVALMCFGNQLTSLDVSQNPVLWILVCYDNQITSLDVSQNLDLHELTCYDNQITSLDVSQNTTLTYVRCQNNQLTYLNVANGNNVLWMPTIVSFNATNNPNLSCIEVDDASWSTANWTVSDGHIDEQQYFSNNCLGTGIEEHTRIRHLLKVTDLLGREVNYTPHQILIHVYDDGSVEKKFVVD